jgi:DNA (cytosine-5)-methyltransferase 1
MWKHMARIIGEVRPKYAFVENSPMLTTRGLGVVLADLSTMGFDAKWGVVSAADVGANHQRERIWIRAKQRNFFPHTEHNRDGWRKQQSESTQEANGKITDTTSIGLHNQENKCVMESQRGRELQLIESRYTNDVAHANLPQCKRKGESIGIQSGFARLRNGDSVVSNTSSIGQSGQGEYVKSLNSEEDSHRKTNYAESIGRPEFWAVEPNVGRVANGVAARVDRLKAIGNGQVPLCAATAWELLK